MKIAVDIDNTIIDYRFLIIKYLKEYNNDFLREFKLNTEISINVIKKNIKDHLGDDIWQKIQALIYSSKNEINFYENVESSFELIGNLGYSINIISHKSKYGIGESRNTNIREIATTRIYDWIYKSKFKKHVTSINFCESFNEKIDRLYNLKPSIIIDDLLKVHLEYRKFSKIENVKFILFNGTNFIEDSNNFLIKNIEIINDWNSITNYIYNLK